MDSNAQNSMNTQNQPQTPPAGPAPQPSMPGPAQMGATPRPAAPPSPISAMPNLGGPRLATPGSASTVPGASARPAAPGMNPTAPAAPTTPVTPTAPTASAPKAEDPAKSKKTMYIILGCIAAVLVVGCIVAAILIMNNNNKKSEPTPAPVSEVQPSAGKTPIDDLDKEGMLAAFDAMHEEGYNPNPDYISDDVLSYLSTHKSMNANDIVLLTSYTDIEDLEAEARESEDYGEDYTVTVDPVDDTFAFVTASPNDAESTEDSEISVAFNSQYLQHPSEEYNAWLEDLKAKGSDVTPWDLSVYHFAFADTSEEFVKKALPILATTSAGGSMPLSVIYDYDYESVGENQATFTIYGIEVTESAETGADEAEINADTDAGVDTDADTDTDTESNTDTDADAAEEESSGYSIASYKWQYNIDLSTGRVTLDSYDPEEESSDDVFTMIQSFPLTVDEALDRVDQSNDDF